jgi:single-strand DNA-binding protein
MSAANVNVAVISGNLTRDPELRHTGGGTAVCDLRVAVNSRRKDPNGDWVDKPNYFDVTVWGAHGETCAQYLAKGRPVAIEGRLDWSEWEAKDGSGNRQAVRIIASTIQFGQKPQGSGTSPSASSETTADNSAQTEMAAGAEVPSEPVGSERFEEEDGIPF